MKCGKCGAETVVVPDESSAHKWLECVRCQFMDTAKGHIQERDRRIEEAAVSIISGRVIDRYEALEMATNLIKTLDVEAQGRTK